MSGYCITNNYIEDNDIDDHPSGGARSRRGRAGLGEKLLWIAAILLLVPDVAYAFGPATHIDLGLHVLRYAALLPPLVRRVVINHPESFLYGGFAADVVVGKNLAQHVHHCHNWQVGFRMLDDAPTPDLEALCWGFLSHLSSDVVAHNYFVPLKLILSYQARTTRHVYWEVRFDQANHESEGVWETLHRMGRARFPEADDFLREELSSASRLLPFEASRRLFNSFMLVSRAERWREMTSSIADRSRWSLSREEFVECRRMAFDFVLAVLIDGRKAAVVGADPTGRDVLSKAKKLRRKLKRLAKKGKTGERLSKPAEDLIKQQLHDGVLRSGANLPSIDEVREAAGEA
jgi:hypothetical protein